MAETACWTTTAPPPAPTGEVERLRAMLAALEAECAKIAETLDEFTHEFVPGPTSFHGNDLSAWCGSCDERADELPHRTVAWLRRRYGFGAM